MADGLECWSCDQAVPDALDETKMVDVGSKVCRNENDKGSVQKCANENHVCIKIWYNMGVLEDDIRVARSCVDPQGWFSGMAINYCKHNVSKILDLKSKAKVKMKKALLILHNLNYCFLVLHLHRK